MQITGDIMKTATVFKANDQPQEPLTIFRLEPFELGTDPDGDPYQVFIVSNEILTGSDQPASHLSPRQRSALECLAEVTLTHGSDLPAELGLPHGLKSVMADQWKTELFRRRVLDPDGTNPRARFNELRSQLADKKLIGVDHNLVWRA